jgi:predicted metal-dependent HD superfamily phosphohydrolase
MIDIGSPVGCRPVAIGTVAEGSGRVDSGRVESGRLDVDTGAIPRSVLARAFDGALVAAGARAEAGERVAAFVDLARRYAELGRHFHTLRHVAETVAALRLLLAAERDVAARVSVPSCVLAGYFHDAVYDPGANDNEDRSARLAVDVLRGLGCPLAGCAAVARLVRATAAHVSSAPDEALVNDADLRILARPAPLYDRYARRVRWEYAWVGAAAWTDGRAAVLRRLLDGPVYATAWARRHWEPAARENLRRELAGLA